MMGITPRVLQIGLIVQFVIRKNYVLPLAVFNIENVEGEELQFLVVHCDCYLILAVTPFVVSKT